MKDFEDDSYHPPMAFYKFTGEKLFGEIRESSYQNDFLHIQAPHHLYGTQERMTILTHQRRSTGIQGQHYIRT